MWPNAKANPIGAAEGDNVGANPMVLHVQLEEYALPVVFPTEVIKDGTEEIHRRGQSEKQVKKPLFTIYSKYIYFLIYSLLRLNFWLWAT